MLLRIFITLFSFSFLLSIPVLGQNTTCDKVYTTVDEMPTWRQTGKDFSLFLLKNLEVPKECYQEKVYILTWTIDKEGNMINIDTPGLEERCKNDIIKQLEKFPTWNPGRLKGMPVCVKMTYRMCIKLG